MIAVICDSDSIHPSGKVTTYLEKHPPPGAAPWRPLQPARQTGLTDWGALGNYVANTAVSWPLPPGYEQNFWNDSGARRALRLANRSDRAVTAAEEQPIGPVQHLPQRGERSRRIAVGQADHRAGIADLARLGPLVVQRCQRRERLAGHPETGLRGHQPAGHLARERMPSLQLRLQAFGRRPVQPRLGPRPGRGRPGRLRDHGRRGDRTATRRDHPQIRATTRRTRPGLILTPRPANPRWRGEENHGPFGMNLFNPNERWFLAPADLAAVPVRRSSRRPVRSGWPVRPG
jgi:hypothetical protein